MLFRSTVVVETTRSSCRDAAARACVEVGEREEDIGVEPVLRAKPPLLNVDVRVSNYAANNALKMVGIVVLSVIDKSIPLVVPPLGCADTPYLCFVVGREKVSAIPTNTNSFYDVPSISSISWFRRCFQYRFSARELTGARRGRSVF